MGSIDGVKMFVESTVTSDHVKDGSVARFVLNVVVVELTNDGELIRSNDGVSVSMFVLDPFGGIESLNFGERAKLFKLWKFEMLTLIISMR